MGKGASVRLHGIPEAKAPKHILRLYCDFITLLQI